MMTRSIGGECGPFLGRTQTTQGSPPMSERADHVATEAAANASQEAPWGITFRYAPPIPTVGQDISQEDIAAQASLAWSKLAWALPGWEIVQQASESNQYMAFPPNALIRTTDDEPSPAAEINKQL